MGKDTIFKDIPGYEIHVGEADFAIHSIRDNVRRAWTPEPITITGDIAPGSLRILTGCAHKWSLDLVVSFGTTEYPHADFTEVWRVSPWRVRRRTPVSDDIEFTGGSVRAGGDSIKFALESPMPNGTAIYEVTVNPVNGAVREVGKLHERPNVYDIFISYKRKDHKAPRPSVPEQVARELAREFTVWVDQQRVETDYWDEIREGIEHSRTFLVFYTDHTREESAGDAHLDTAMDQGRELDEIVALVGESRNSKTPRKLFTYYMGSHQDEPLPEEYARERWHVMYSSHVDVKQLIRTVKKHLREVTKESH
jgi:hypothetical protein